MSLTLGGLPLQCANVKREPKYSFGGKGSPLFRNNNPGPGAYAVTDSIDGRKPRPLAFSFRPKPRPIQFNSNPGPGSYNHDTTNGKPTSSRGGFSQSARSPGGYKTYQIPGPGSYDVPNRFGGPGYSLRSRVKGLDRNQTPGPGAYELSDEVDGVATSRSVHGVSKHMRRGAKFSQSMRDLRFDSSTPGPGSYEVSASATAVNSTMPVYSLRSAGRPNFRPKIASPGPGSYYTKYSIFAQGIANP
mmetsp:Transcript_1990/g.4610  ORF Transcript_1990/g.4610 Transcript_1990/m.4610 type:complete len:245 (+) Transcript_1990:244-978(+)|eukprot:CAMPEP_0178999426 /NCGR_PEP_ID=MMETSP0795-20121207/10056_1 /TAXON_ID=88552 /ORGANISM="Amoebophrya sp., Strain Ameob2" /LENGTH=244 /DNA_ID=CAMNT_0020692203 /DNA_START=181 /DNA_END=915 /DNA_ORIENTATION=+